MRKLLLLASIAIISSSAIAADNKVVATVNGQNIYEKSLNVLYDTIPAENIEHVGGEKKVKDSIVEQLVAAEVLKQAAIKSDISKSEEFKEILKIETERLTQEEFLRKELEKRISEKDIKTEYDRALKEFKAENEYDLYNILSKTEEDAKKIITELDGGSDFQKLAVEKSVASNAKENKGHIGFVKKSDLVKNIADEITNLKKGKYSKEPVETPFGWNVFYLKDKRLEKTPSYKDTKEAIKQALYKSEVQKLINELKEKAEITIK